MPEPTYPITGILAGWDEWKDSWHKTAKYTVPVRVEADDFFLNEEYATQRDLLYQAMAIFQDMSPREMTSYFQVAGIHGLPHVPWDAPGSYAPQYCQHAKVNFASWHRPYMMLFEQRLYEIMVNQVIPPYKDDKVRAAMKTAADQFRMPYWDWALTKPRKVNGKDAIVYDLPLIVKPETVEITQPIGGTRPIPNPFYKFQAKRAMGEFGVTPIQISKLGETYEAIYFNRTISTSRIPAPEGEVGKRAPPDDFYTEKGIAGLEGSAKNIQEADWYQWPEKDKPPGSNFKLAEATYRLLSSTYFTSFTRFVTALQIEEVVPSPDDGKFYLSLEGIHNNIHDWTGQEWGHMGHVPVAAFDPIFWLHHCNMDRVMAIWQERNPEKWWTEAPIKDKDGKIVGTVRATDKLKPFHTDTKGNLYDSNNCKDHFALGYTYPELQPWKYKDNDEYQSSIQASNAQKYRPPAETLVRSLANHDVIVNVSFEKFSLSGIPFTVRVFLADKLIGEVHNFSTYSEADDGESGTGCENCQQQQASNVIVTGQVFMSEELTEAARDTPELKNLTKEEIMAYVKANLNSKVYLLNGNEVTIPSLEVTPWIGQRELFKVPLPHKEEAAFKITATANAVDSQAIHKQRLEGGIVDLPEIKIEDLPVIKASWAEDGRTVLVYGTEEANSSEPIAAVRVGKWSAYEAF